MPALERRSLEVEVRAPEDDARLEQDGLPRRFWARVVNYDTLDDYGTLFRSGCFDAGLQHRLPRLMYGHGGWDNPHALIGKGIEHRTSKEGLDVLFELDDFDYVPVAKQIAYQMSNEPPTLDRFSVGFKRKRDSRAPSKGGTYIEEAALYEVSVLPEGSVPGTKLLSFRAPNGEEEDLGPHVIAVDDAVRILTRYSLGEIGLVEALQSVVEESTASLSDEDFEGEEEEDDDSAADPGGPDDDPAVDAPGDDDEDRDEDVDGDPESDVVVEAAPEEDVTELLEEADLLLAGRGTVVEVRRDFTQKERDTAVKKKQAMPGGGFPIKNAEDLRNAIQAIGRAKNPEAAKAHIITQARKLGLYDSLPKEWTRKS